MDEQVSKGTYSMDSNLALLRLYQFYPDRVKPTVLSKILIKALMRLPEPDFLLCTHLVPERLQLEDPFATLANAAGALEGARFKEFWALAASIQDLLDTVPDFPAAVREFALYLVSTTYQTIDKAVLGEMLNLQGGALDAFFKSTCAARGWTEGKGEDGGDVYNIPKNADNDPQPSVEETLPYQSLQEMFVAVA